MKKGCLLGMLLGLVLSVTACGSGSVPVSEDVSCYNRGAYETDEGTSDSESVPVSEDVSGYCPPDYATDGGESDPVVFGTFYGNDFVIEEIESGQYTEFTSGVSVQYFVDNSSSYEAEIFEGEDGEKYVDYTFGGDDTCVSFTFRNGSVPSSYGEWCGRPCVDDGLENYYIGTYTIDGVENCVDDIHWGKCTKDSSPEDFEAEFGASLLTDWNHNDSEQTLVYASQTHFIEFHFIDGVLHRVKCDTLWFYGFST